MPTLATSTSIAEVFPENLLRKSFIIQNEDSAINVFVRQEKPELTDAVSSTVHDHRIGPGGSIAINRDTDGKQSIIGRWTVISASGTPLISFFETEDVER